MLGALLQVAQGHAKMQDYHSSERYLVKARNLLVQIEALAKEWTLSERCQDELLAIIFDVYAESTKTSWENRAMVCRIGCAHTHDWKLGLPKQVPALFLILEKQ